MPDADQLTSLLANEEAKRKRCADPAQRWRTIQETIRWAEEQQGTRARNRKENRLREQRDKLTALARWQASINRSP